MSRTWICRGCQQPTTEGTICADCRRGFGRQVRNRAYDTPEWRRHRERVLAEHRAQYGDWCPGFRRGPHPSIDLTVDHVQALASGGALLGETQVLCRSCNTRKRWADTPTRRRRR